jgi:hypothetical protein
MAFITQQSRSLSDFWEKRTVHTDRQSQQSIFQNDIASALKRLQKMTVFLPCHSFALFYRKGTSLYLADTLSRAPCIEKA